MDIAVIYEDEDILVIDKPAGMVVNRAETTRPGETVQDWAENQFRILSSSAGRQNLEFRSEQGDFFSRGGVVHRLDKETSGILILAKNPEAFAELQRQFKERVVKKTYNALAHGEVVPANGEISVPVGRLPWNRMQFGVVPGGRESVTFYKVLRYYKDGEGEMLSFLELFPKTGRTHQIRVHLKYIGHPIFADFLYAGRKTSKKDRGLLNRVFLHAKQLSFLHPKTGEEMTFESPLPHELDSVLSKFDIKNT
jgi:23S rRNA pseudouridine1911/1915/1917 synthase